MRVNFESKTLRIIKKIEENMFIELSFEIIIKMPFGDGELLYLKSNLEKRFSVKTKSDESVKFLMYRESERPAFLNNFSYLNVFSRHKGIRLLEVAKKYPTKFSRIAAGMLELGGIIEGSEFFSFLKSKYDFTGEETNPKVVDKDLVFITINNSNQKNTFSEITMNLDDLSYKQKILFETENNLR